jgi:hypothetical protein
MHVSVAPDFERVALISRNGLEIVPLDIQAYLTTFACPRLSRGLRAIEQQQYIGKADREPCEEYAILYGTPTPAPPISLPVWTPLPTLESLPTLQPTPTRQ